MVVCVCTASTAEADVGGLKVQGQPGLYTKFKDNLDYIDPVSKQTTEKNYLENFQE